ncbi:TPA: PTS transporter subunit EIIC [Clostridioides difficile]|nr:PTS transporter subunit EIIC [Clostridioides difficile]HBF5047131.1 PTS transporter subunit EIIC [Clostridioides difficile]HBF5113593.1 PTS transporter subunit EIIC [Clostridioides difficile]HBF5876184.1 PTS transporter subunit EIIC [Clostridioides difficile]HBH3595266.1 PTS transporter subunit EIIC [Clostridioides difficile]
MHYIAWHFNKNGGNNTMKDKLQVLSGAMMIPVILLVVAGVFIGLGSAFANMENVSALGLSGLIKEGSFINVFFKVINDLGFMVMRYLPIFFVTGIAFGLSKKEKGWGALGGIVLFIGMHTVISTLLAANGINSDTVTAEAFMASGLGEAEAYSRSSLYGSFLGIFSYDCSIFGAIIAGFVASAVHNKFVDIELPSALSFFSGPRFSMIMMFIASIVLGTAMYFIWPPVGLALSKLGNWIGSSGLLGTFTFGAMDKALLPFGIHHLIAFPIEYTRVGGTMEVGGAIYEGVNNIRLAQMGDPDTLSYITRNFTTGRLLIHFAILPAAALAMYKLADNANKKKAISILIPAIVTAMLVGVTEPIEYTFLFVAPLLYFVAYVPLAGLTYVFTEMFNVSIMGESFRNMFPNLLQPQKVDALPLLFLIPIFFIVTYIIFTWAIKKFDIKTPGRSSEEVKLYSKKEYRERQSVGAGKTAYNNALEEEADDKDTKLVHSIIEGLGGSNNIKNVTNCATRLRVELNSIDGFYEDGFWVNELGASGVVKKKNSVQVIFGPRVITIASKLKAVLGVD